MEYKRQTLSDQLNNLKPPHSAEPTQVKLARVRREIEERTKLRGETPPDQLTAGSLRLFYCRSCGLEARAIHVPEGWYTMQRHLPEDTIRLGTYCSIRCLIEQLPRLVGIEEDLKNRNAPLEFPRYQLPREESHPRYLTRYQARKETSK